MADLSKPETNLIYACSGAADVGAIADQVARRLRSEGVAKMTCLAGIGAELPSYVQSAKDSDVNIAIDGCSVAWAKKTLEKIGVIPVSFILTDMGLVKGETPVAEKTIIEMCEKIKSSNSNSAPPVQTGTGGCSCDGKC